MSICFLKIVIYFFSSYTLLYQLEILQLLYKIFCILYKKYFVQNPYLINLIFK